MAAIPDPGSEGTTETVEVFATYRAAWGRLWDAFGPLLAIYLIAMVLGSLGSGVRFVLAPPWGTPSTTAALLGQAVSGLYSVLVGIPLGFGAAYAYLKAARGQTPEIEDLFEGFRVYATSLGAGLLVVVTVIAGLFLLIIPGIVAAVRLQFVPYLVTDKRLGAVDAFKESWARTKGHSWRLFGLILLAFPIVLAGLLLLIVGVIPALIWVAVATALFYHRVTGDPASTPDRVDPGSGDPGPPPTTEPAAGASIDTMTRER